MEYPIAVGAQPRKRRCTALLNRKLKAISKTLVLFFVDLQSTFHKIKWSNSSMCNTTRQKSAKATKGVILAATNLTRIFLSTGCRQFSTFRHRSCKEVGIAYLAEDVHIYILIWISQCTPDYKLLDNSS